MIKQTIKRISQGLAVVPLLALLASIALPGSFAFAAECTSTGSTQGTGTINDGVLGTDPLTNGTKCAKGAGQGNDLVNVFRTVANIMLFLVGAVAVIMLIIGGLRYVTSGGDQTAVTGAKNTILYAIVGIVVAFLAFAAVNFVTSALNKNVS